MPTDKNNQAPRKLTKITVEDNRGTRLEVSLFIAGPMLHDYIKETMQVWADQWDGRADKIHVYVEGEGGFEWIKPGEMKDQQPHQPA